MKNKIIHLHHRKFWDYVVQVNGYNYNNHDFDHNWNENKVGFILNYNDSYQ